MAGPEARRNLLVVRPWVTTGTGPRRYAHFDALPMRPQPGWTGARYGGLNPLCSGDDGRTTLRLERFRFRCQVDDREPAAYAWEWGYMPLSGDIFNSEHVARYGASYAAIAYGLARLQRQDGPADRVGGFVVRLARVLRLDGIVVLAISGNGRFADALAVRRTIERSDLDDAAAAIDQVVTELHQRCTGQIPHAAT